jgi:phenylacetate-CoA ligase
MPITFLDDQYSASYRIALWLRRFWNFGIRPRDKAFVVVPGEHRASTLSQTKGLIGAVLRWKVRRMSLSDDMEDHVGQILKWKPNVIVGPPSYFRSVVEIANESRVQLSARVAVVCGELLDRTTRDRISGELGADVFETYGVSEVGGIAWECPSRSGYHLNSDSSIIELLQDGEHVAEGESGEVCVTNLWRKPTPLIRYRVGDMASYLGDDCSCGRGLPLIKNLQGRIIDFVITRGGKPISPFRVMFMMEGFPAIGQYKVVQRSDYSIEVSVRTVEKPFEAVRPALENECKQLFEDTPFTITDKEKFEVTRGDKFRVVESEIKR